MDQTEFLAQQVIVHLERDSSLSFEDCEKAVREWLIVELEYPIFEALLTVLKAVRDNGISQYVARKVGSGVFVKHDIVTCFNERYPGLIKYLYRVHNVNLFGTCCACSKPCSCSSFLGTPNCQARAYRLMLLNMYLPSELSHEICKMMLPKF